METIYIADDFALTREGLIKILNRVQGLQVVGGQNKASKTEVLEDLKALKTSKQTINLIVLDITWRGDEGAGIEILKWAKNNLQNTRVMMITSYPDLLKNARVAKADSVLFKDFTAEEFVSEIKRTLGSEINYAVACEDYGLTETEKIILGQLETSDKDIALDLGISVFTVKKHVANILIKLNVSNRTAAVKKSFTERLLENN